MMQNLLHEVIIPDQVCQIDGFRVNIRSLSQALLFFNSYLSHGKSFYICTMNLDHVVKLRRSEDFRKVYRVASFVTLDSTPLVWLKRLTGVSVSKAAGADLISPICRLVAEQSLPVFLVGPDPRVNVLFFERARAEFGGFERVFHVSPSVEFDPNSQEADKIIQLIADSDARLCFVGLGAPKQEIFSFRASSSIEGVGFIPVGAAIEFMAGTKRRAPKWMQQFGLEWTWRLKQEPLRLSSRYFYSLIMLIRLGYLDVLKIRGNR